MALCFSAEPKYIKKIKSFAHGEFNKEKIVNENIKLRIQGEDVFERGYDLKIVEIDHCFQNIF